MLVLPPDSCLLFPDCIHKLEVRDLPLASKRIWDQIAGCVEIRSCGPPDLGLILT